MTTRVAIRMLDLAVASIALLVSLPLWPIIVVAVKLTSPGPAFYRSTRIGRDERLFPIVKFRTMAAGDGPRITAAGDARVTPVGRILRATKLDELPQLLCVLKGDMALVGPRPEDPRYLDAFPRDLRAVFRWKPGITGPASIEYRHEEVLLARAPDPEAFYVAEVLPAKARIDIEYCRTRTVRSDVAILATTAKAILHLRPSR